MRRVLSPLLSPKSVAVIGASDNPSRIGGRPLSQLRGLKFRGGLYPVHPTHENIQGLQAYRSIRSVPEPVDCAILAIPRERVMGVLEECADSGVRGAVVFSAGFAESGGAGREDERLLAQLTRRTGMRVLGPNCLGAFNLEVGAWLSFTAAVPTRIEGSFQFALVSQSGGVGSNLLAMAHLRGLSINQFVTTGNEVDVEIGEVLETFAEDDTVDGILLYVEGLRRSESFLRGLETARLRRKPVILVKVGTTTAGAEAAASHTASLAGDDAMYDAVLRGHAVHRAASIEEMFDVARAAARRRYPAGRRLCVVSTSGGFAALAVDAAVGGGFTLPEMPASAQEVIRGHIPAASTRNPVDVTGQFLSDPGLVGMVMGELIAARPADTMFTFLGQIAANPVMRTPLLRQMKEAAASAPDMLHMVSVTGEPELATAYEAAGYLQYEDPLRAMGVLNALASMREGFDRPAQPVAVRRGMPKMDAERYNEADARAVLQRAGVSFIPAELVKNAAEADAAALRQGFPVALKVVSHDLAHKSDVGGVALHLRTPSALKEAFERMQRDLSVKVPTARIDGFLVSPMAPTGVECVVGLHQDPVFGPMVMFGLGGVLVEVLGDVVWLRAGFGRDDARALVLSIRGAALLTGVRGRSPADIEALVDLLLAISDLALTNTGRLRSLELNPVLVLPQGQGVLALDALIDLYPSTNQESSH
ncbi:acetate--CoA ligase family protein [Hydrogenophaga sp. BPS33]|uniref:acetate--CoA ligase family protein n=1 Tax=Hydrogenophaga sp. BPS33 TaxID=2651974 RepID=UPI0013202702|nr:acetate--CoA ligase family protein [Hydrogenophaga sp. BPS33]QHE84508.1 acetate--CoA ligase family protein [Hydrogenophaga sp. BPS33]